MEHILDANQRDMLFLYVVVGAMVVVGAESSLISLKNGIRMIPAFFIPGLECFHPGFLVLSKQG